MTPYPRLPTHLYPQLLWRETRGSGRRFLFFVACLAIGVAAVVCVAGITGNLDRQIRTEARQLLAADLEISGLGPLPEAVSSHLQEDFDLEVTDLRELVTVVARESREGQPGKSLVVELKVVDGRYPFYGTLSTEPAEPLGELLAPDTVVVAPDLLRRLGLSAGDDLKIGSGSYRVSGTVLSEPDRIATPFSLGPRVFLSAAGFDRTGLETLGSRIVYRALLRLPPDTDPERLAEIRTELEDLVGPAGPFRVRTYIDSQEELRQALARAASFLALVALLSLLLGGLGIAQTTRAWLTERMDDIATLRCLGLLPSEVLVLYLGQTILLALLGSAIGVGTGVLIQALLPYLFAELLGGMPWLLWQPGPILKGLVLGLSVALLFSLRSLWTVRSVAPLRALRRDVEPLPQSRLAQLTMYSSLAVGIWLIASAQADSWIRGLTFTLGLAGASLLLAGLAVLLMRSLAPLARNVEPLWLRHGVLALARPGSATVVAVVSLGIGVLLILGLHLVEDRLEAQLRSELPDDSPTAFLVNIQAQQWSAIESLLTAEGASQIDSVPFVTARLRSVDGRQVADLVGDPRDEHRRWALTREQRLTYMERLPEDNRIIAGALWSWPAEDEVSVEADFARDLGAEVGSTLGFDIQGVPLDLRVSSIRTVEWESFGINFFLVVEPGVLDQAPQQRVATVRLPLADEQRIQDRLAAAFPNVTLLKIREILERIATVLDMLASGVGFIGAFTVIAGVVILAGGVSADSVRRRRNIALLKTLGVTQRGISAMLAVEFAVIGAVAGVIGAAGGNLLAWAVVTHGLEIEWRVQPLTVLAAIAVTLLLATSTGILSSRTALRQPPAAVLRGE